MTALVIVLVVLACLAIVWVSFSREHPETKNQVRRRSAEERKRAQDERDERRKRMGLK